MMKSGRQEQESAVGWCSSSRPNQSRLQVTQRREINIERRYFFLFFFFFFLALLHPISPLHSTSNKHIINNGTEGHQEVECHQGQRQEAEHRTPPERRYFITAWIIQSRTTSHQELHE